MTAELKQNEATGAPASVWKHYPVYKDSGVEWLGKVPEHWEITKIKEYSEIINGYPFDSTKFNNNDGFPLVRIRDILNNKTETFYKGEIVVSALIDNGSMLIGMDGDFQICKWQGGKALLNQRICWIKGKKNIVESYLLYLLPIPIKIINDLTYYTTVKHLSSNDIQRISFPLPPLEEQCAIARFLDDRTRKIDTLIEKKQKMIEMLEEERVAVINQAVTKGLNPDAPMKDSGIEWLGMVPEKWDVTRLKFICYIIKDGTHQPPSRKAIGIPLLSVRNIVNGKFVNLDDDSLISMEDYMQLKRSIDVLKNDILLAIVGATLGKVAIVEKMEPFTIQRSLAVFRPIPELMHFKYLAYFFQSYTFQRILWKNAGFSEEIQLAF